MPGSLDTILDVFSHLEGICVAPALGLCVVSRGGPPSSACVCVVTTMCAMTMNSSSLGSAALAYISC